MLITDRRQRALALLAEHDLDALMFCARENLRYLCGFTGSDGVLLITAAYSLFLTDSRYTTQAQAQVSADRVEEYRLQADAVLAESKHEALSRKSMVSFSKPPFIKIVQAMSKPPVKPSFKDLDIIVAPQMIKIGDSSTPFTFVPIYFFPSWACINPANMAGQLPFFREYSLDAKSSVAQKAKTFVTEDCPENPREEIKYIQILNFVIVLEDNLDISGTPVLLFFNKGEFKVGQGLIGQITIRQGNVPCYACRFRAGSNNHSGKKGTWYGLDMFCGPRTCPPQLPEPEQAPP